MSIAKFRVYGRFHRAGGQTAPATVSIDRATGVVTIRPYKAKTVWTTTLSAMAEMAVARMIKTDVGFYKTKKGRGKGQKGDAK